MPRRKSVGPTEAELEVLHVLWTRGPSTVRQVHKVLGPRNNTAFNTTLKILQIMYEKDIVKRDDSERPHVYWPAVPQEQTQRQLVSTFVKRAFGGSARKLVAALTASGISEEELAEIRQLFEELEEERG